MTAPETVKWLDEEIARLRERVTGLTEARRYVMRQRVDACEMELVKRQVCATSELIRWLEVQMGSTWDGAPAEDMAAAVKKFMEEQKQRGSPAQKARG